MKSYLRFFASLFFLVFHRAFQMLIASALLTATSACLSEPRLVDHSFEFDARRDSPDIEVLDYRYGTSNHPGAQGCPKNYSPCAQSRQYAGITGEMLLGDEIYVKWKVNSTGYIYEDTVDLSKRLPMDMRKQRIYFIINGSRLYIFVINLESKIKPNPCPSQDERHRLDHSPIPIDKVFSRYCSKQIMQAYPIQLKLQ